MQTYESLKAEVLAEADLAGEVLTDAEVDRRVRDAAGLPSTGRRRPVAIDGIDMPSLSRLEGAPSADIGVDLGLTPPGYMDDLGEMPDYYRDGGASQPPPGSSAYDLEGDILQYRPGMTPEEYDNAKAQQRDRVRMIRGMGGDGGFQAQVHPQQVMDIGTAEDNEKWNEWVAEDPARMQRYDPAGFAAWQAAQEAEFVRDHGARLAEKYGPQAAAEWQANRRSGGPVDFSILRTPMEEGKVRTRRENEMLARGGRLGGNNPQAPVGLAEAESAREMLRLQDEQSGYSGAMGGSAVSQSPAAGVGPDGQVETKAERFARRTAGRQGELDARKMMLRNQNLFGRPTGTTLTMMQDPFNDGLTENQRRALAYMMPGGDLAAEVDAANFQQASELAASGLRGLFGPMVAGSMNDGQPPAAVPFSDGWRMSPQQQSQLKAMALTYPDETIASRNAMKAALEAEGMSPAEAQGAVDWAMDQNNRWR